MEESWDREDGLGMGAKAWVRRMAAEITEFDILCAWLYSRNEDPGKQ